MTISSLYSIVMFFKKYKYYTTLQNKIFSIVFYSIWVNIENIICSMVLVNSSSSYILFCTSYYISINRFPLKTSTLLYSEKVQPNS